MPYLCDCTCIYTCMCTCVQVGLCMYAFTPSQHSTQSPCQSHTCHWCVHVYMSTCVCVCTHTCTHNACMCKLTTCIHTWKACKRHSHIYAHMRPQVCVHELRLERDSDEILTHCPNSCQTCLNQTRNTHVWTHMTQAQVHTQTTRQRCTHIAIICS
jgi:hypothetical protein